MGRGLAPVVTGEEKGGRGLGETLEGSTDKPPALPYSDLKSGQTSGSLGCRGTIGPFQNECFLVIHSQFRMLGQCLFEQNFISDFLKKF